VPAQRSCWKGRSRFCATVRKRKGVAVLRRGLSPLLCFADMCLHGGVCRHARLSIRVRVARSSNT
jgi:hypothetical protein